MYKQQVLSSQKELQLSLRQLRAKNLCILMLQSCKEFLLVTQSPIPEQKILSECAARKGLQTSISIRKKKRRLPHAVEAQILVNSTSYKNSAQRNSEKSMSNIGKKRKRVGGGWIPREVSIAYANAKPYIKAISPRIHWLISSYQ